MGMCVCVCPNNRAALCVGAGSLCGVRLPSLSPSRTTTSSQTDADLRLEAYDPSFPQNHLHLPLRLGRASVLEYLWVCHNLIQKGGIREDGIAYFY